MAAPAQSKRQAQQDALTDEPTVVGWHGLRFFLPPEWNITAFSMDKENGYLKVDSPGTMFAQVKWTQPGASRPKTLGDVLARGLSSLRRKPAVKEHKAPDLRPMLDSFLKQTAKLARKNKAAFESKVKPEVKEAGGERTALHFSWTGAGQGQGKIWHCSRCGRVVIAQVVGQAKDPVQTVASRMFGTFADHAEGGWSTWALYDLVAAAPEDYALKAQKLMSGYLKLEFERRGGERIFLERWGLANVTRRKFTVAEWFETACNVSAQRVEKAEGEANGHEASRATGRIRGPLAWFRAVRDGMVTLKPATLYDGCCWECPDTNKIYAVQVWHNKRTKGLLSEVVARCECH